jgi:predicted PolB exonuclease-like 3'-5' exonuclease
MLDQLRLEEVLFLDIETVPQQSDFNELDEDLKQLWTDKSKYSRERNGTTLEESYSEAGIYAEFGKIVCISVGYFALRMQERVLRVTSFYGHDEYKLLADFSELLETRTNHPFRMLCAHNGKEFDFPYLCRRMLINRIKLPLMLNIAGKKPWEVAHLDTMELWKFGDYKNYTSIKVLAKVFGIPTPKDDIDGSQVRSVYYEQNDLDRIEAYCKKDVATVARLLQCYKGETPVSDDQVVYV